jgi:hypothetical protein
MEQSRSWEANWFSASQEIPRILWNPKVHYHIHKCPPPVLILRQLDPVPWRSIFILSSHLRLGLPSCLFSSGFPTKILYTPLLYPIRATCPTHLILLNFITRTILGEEYRSFSTSLYLLNPSTEWNIERTERTGTRGRISKLLFSCHKTDYEQGSWWNCIMRSWMICTPHPILFGW